ESLRPSGSLQKAEGIALRARKGGCSQRPSEHRAGIEIQAVAAKIRDAVGLRRVAMNDQAAVVARVRKKRLSDPNEIVVALGVERLLRIDAGVNEKTLTVVVAERKRAQPTDMRMWKVARVVDVVAPQCCRATLAQPDLRIPLAVDDFDCERLMISLQRDHAIRPPRLQVHQRLDDAATVRTAIDVIPEKHKGR